MTDPNKTITPKNPEQLPKIKFCEMIGTTAHVGFGAVQNGGLNFRRIPEVEKRANLVDLETNSCYKMSL